MKRSGIFIILSFFITLTAAYMAAEASNISATKHNLSTGGTGSIKSDTGGTSEICVFCHTPHSSRMDAPLWNRTNPAPVGGYTPYGSDVMTALSYTVGDSDLGSGLLHVKTRICLSCHDGTIALGKLVNLPPDAGGSEITMVNTGNPVGGSNAMPYTAQGYIGTDLRDDHPVAIKYFSTSPDPELGAIGSLAFGGPIYLYDSNAVRTQFTDGSGYIECTTCHNAHDNQYGNFLVGSNYQSEICRACHAKTDFVSSIHNTALGVSDNYSPPTNAANPGNPQYIGTKVGEVKCMNCHFPHKAAGTGTPPNLSPNTNLANKAGYYLLSFAEEDSCFNTNNDRWNTSGSASVCHGSGAPAARKIKTLVDGTKSRYHPVMDSSKARRHEATEARQQVVGGWAGASVWHVECADCHNPHTAGSSLHSRGTNTVTNTSLYGTGGVNVVSYPDWALWPNPTGNYSVPPTMQAAGVTNNAITGIDYEYQICLKCHSDFAWGTNPPAPLTNPLDASYSALTNQALEFGNNAGTASSHPVIFTNSNNQGTYVSPWTSGLQYMYCSDCHNNDSARSPFGTGTDAVGPHGSNNRAILYRSYNPTTVGQNTSTDLCYGCHDSATYYSNGAANGSGFNDGGARNLHYWHMNPAGFTYQGGVTKTCTRCHVNPPHGINRTHLISRASWTGSTPDPAPYGSNSYIKSYSDPTSGNYAANGSNCSAATCHSGAHP